MDNFNLVVLSARAGYNFNRRLLKKKRIHTYIRAYSAGPSKILFSINSERVQV